MSVRLVVDLSNKSAQVIDKGGRSLLAWSEVTRSSAVPLAHAAGWRRAGGWALTYPPDGFWCPVEPCETGEST
jgi:hypothetical protein